MLAPASLSRAACLVAVAVLAFGSGCKKAHERLAGHAEEITKILDDNMSDPADAVEPIREYLRDNLPDIAEDMATVLVELDEKSASDRKDHADEVLEALEDPLEDLVKTWSKFESKASDDEDFHEEAEDIAKSYSGVLKQLSKLEKKVESEPEAVAEIRGLADEMCECTSMDCANKVSKKLNKFAKGFSDTQLKERHEKRLKKDVERLTECMTKAMKR